MDKLKPVSTPELAFFQGYLEAASEIFIGAQVDATLEVYAFEIIDRSVTANDIVAAAYGDDDNKIENVQGRSVEELETEINAFLTIERGFWRPNSVPAKIETHLRQGYWESLSKCIDYKDSRAFDLGNDVPCINVGPGFTYILYNKEMTQCVLLIGNTTD